MMAIERLKNDNMELNTAKLKDEIELRCYENEVDELDLRVNQLERDMQVLMSKQLKADDDEKKPTRVSNSSKSSNFHLPMDLIIEILSRLPVKTLFRFTAVCKTWKSLIESTYFISKHLKQYPLNPDLSCSSLIVTYKRKEDADKEHDNKDICFGFDFENVVHEPVELEIVYSCQMDYLTLVGVCDGLICVSLSYKNCDFVIGNPATVQSNLIPPCQQWNIDLLDNGCGLFGFGLHPSANDYKLVIITYTCELSNVYMAHIYSMSSDDWQVFGLDMPLCDLEATPSSFALVVAKGVFYWEVEKKHSDEWVLVSFNMNDELLRLVDTPQCCEWYTYDVIQWKDEVAIISEVSDDKRSFDMWLLNAVAGRWSKTYKVELHFEIEFGDIDFIGCSKNGDLLFEDRREKNDVQLYSYDTAEKEIYKLHVGDVKNYDSYCYVDSLLPVKKKKNSHTYRDETDMAELTCGRIVV